MSKGEKGKVSSKNEENDEKLNNKNKNLLFKFQSIKPVIDKYFLT